MGGPFRTWRQKDSVREAHQKLKKQLEQRQIQVKNADNADNSKPVTMAMSDDTRNRTAEEWSRSPDKDVALVEKPVKQIIDLKKLNLSKVNFKQILGLQKEKRRIKERKFEPYTFCWPKVSYWCNFSFMRLAKYSVQWLFHLYFFHV